MPKYIVVETQAAYVEFFHEIEANSPEEALSKYESREHETKYLGHTVNESVDFMDPEITLANGELPKHKE